MLICLGSERVIQKWLSDKLFAAITTWVVDLSYICKVGTLSIIEVRPCIETQHIGIDIRVPILRSWRPSRRIGYVSRLRFWRLVCVAVRQII